jgi:hypothetical protein
MVLGEGGSSRSRIRFVEIALIVIAAVLLLLFVGGYIASRRRTRNWSEHVADAERALEAAWAADKGWDRGLLDLAVKQALEAQRPGWEYGELHLVMVDDRPGVAEDTAHFVATGGDDEARVVLARDASGEWRVASVS